MSKFTWWRAVSPSTTAPSPAQAFPPHTFTPLHIAFVTDATLPQLTPDDRLAAAALGAAGIAVTPAAWDDARVDWRAFDLVIIRSPWDYFRRPSEFAAWLDHVERQDVRCWNPVPLLRWNSDKRYLRDLEARGVRIVPTRFVPDVDAGTVSAAMAALRADDAVIKPAVSGGAFRTQRLRRGEQLHLPDDPGEPTTSWLVQPYLEEVSRAGEWSLIFLGGRFSHAVRKRPASGDFRVQQQLGGIATAERPPATVLASAERVLEAVRLPWLYARVDGVELGGAFTLMELEMLEPSLFLESDAEAPARFVEAVRGLVGGGA